MEKKRIKPCYYSPTEQEASIIRELVRVYGLSQTGYLNQTGSFRLGVISGDADAVEAAIARSSLAYSDKGYEPVTFPEFCARMMQYSDALQRAPRHEGTADMSFEKGCKLYAGNDLLAVGCARLNSADVDILEKFLAEARSLDIDI